MSNENSRSRSSTSRSSSSSSSSNNESASTPTANVFEVDMFADEPDQPRRERTRSSEQKVSVDEDNSDIIEIDSEDEKGEDQTTPQELRRDFHSLMTKYPNFRFFMPASYNMNMFTSPDHLDDDPEVQIVHSTVSTILVPIYSYSSPSPPPPSFPPPSLSSSSSSSSSPEENLIDLTDDTSPSSPQKPMEKTIEKERKKKKIEPIETMAKKAKHESPPVELPDAASRQNSVVIEELKKRLQCPICLNDVKNCASTKCGHIFCFACIRKCIRLHKRCPTCRKELNRRDTHRIYF